MLSAPLIHPEIEALAEALGHDPLRAFNWVRNKIDYKHYRGAKKGALITLVERSGNDYDQSLLLRDILIASGVDAQLAFGYTTIPYQHVSQMDVRHWLGLPDADDINLHAQIFLANRGTIYDGPQDELGWDDENIYMGRVWVVASIGGQSYHLDPSFKKYEQVSSMDLVSATGYVRSSALGALAGTVGDSNRSIKSANQTNFGNYLKDCVTTLVQVLAQPANVSKTLVEITGGWRLLEWEATQLSETFPLALTFGAYFTFSEVPADRVATITLRLGSDPENNQVSLTLTKPLPELEGRRLTLEFVKSGNNTKAQIWLDDTLWGEEPSFVSGATTKLQIKIDHPASGDHLDQTFTQTYKRKVSVNGMPNGTPIYSLSYGFDVSQESLRRRERMLENYKVDGEADNGRKVMGETLNIIGQQWYLQTQLVEGILSGLTGSTQQSHHRIGRIAQEEGIYIDVMGQRSGTQSRVMDAAEGNAVFTTSGFYWSAMEHGVLDQLQNLSAASTVGLISRANALGHKLFVLKTIGDYNAIQSQLTNYTAAQKTAITDKLNTGSVVVLPLNGKLKMDPADAWQGTGYVHSSSSEIGMIISGGYNGGYSGKNTPLLTAPVIQTTYTSPIRITPQPVSIPKITAGDPVDLSNGSFLVEADPDIELGESLELTRSYHGAQRTQNDAAIGYGWTHSGHILLHERSSVESAMGMRSATDMAATLVSAVAVLDLYRTRDAGTDYQKKWLGSLLVANLAVNVLKNNSVTVLLPDKVLEFIRQPDGTFTSPPGIPVALSQNGNTYNLTPRHGSTTTFEASVPAIAGRFRIKETTDLWGRKHTYTYNNTTGRLTGIADPFGRSLSLHYQNNRLTSVTDSTGRGVSYGYNGEGNLTTFTDAEGKKDRFVYDALHRIVETRDHSNRIVVKNFFDDQHRVIEQYNQGLSNRVYRYRYAPDLTREEDPTGAVTFHLFDARKRSIGSIDALGNRHSIQYDARDRQIAATTPLGRTTSAVYDAHDNLLSTTDATGATTHRTYDAQHRLISVTDPLSRTTTFTYNAKHQVLTVTNALNETTTHTYDPATGWLTGSTNHAGHTTSFEYDTYGALKKTTLPGNIILQQHSNARGDIQWSEDARGIRTTYTYNLRREPLSATTGGRTTLTSYDGNRMPDHVTNARGFSTSTTHSATGKPLTTQAPDGATFTTAYDTRDNPATSTGPMGEVTRMLHDPLNRPATIIDPLEQATTTLFDEDGFPVGQQAPLSRNSSTAYQIASGQPRLVTHTDPLSRSTISEYDAAGQHRYLTNRNGQVYEMVYDGLGRVTQVIQPGGRTLGTAYSWNSTGLVETITEPSSQSTTLQHDALGRIITRTGPDATTGYTYDASGNLLTVTEGSNVLIRTYEADRDLVSTYTNATGASIGYTYDANGNLATLVYPGGRTVHYSYDENDQLVKVTDWNGRVTRLGYDLSGRMTTLNRANGTSRAQAYDAAGQLRSITEQASDGSLIAYQGWRYDAGGRATQRLRMPGATAFSSPAFSATYHADNRLATLTPQGGSAVTVSSDADGNLLTVPLWEAGQTWANATLSWDARNRLTGALGVSYVYDAEGHLVTRTEGAQSTHYTVDPNAVLSQVLIANHPDGSKTFYVYGEGLLYEETFDAGDVSLGTRSYHYDQVGSTIALSDDAGLVTGRLEYTVYGLTSHSSGNVATPFRYNGRYGVMTDETTGLLHMRARWYSPSIGRFLNEDPIGFSGGLNWYAYADGNPISLLDPFGFGAVASSGSRLRTMASIGVGALPVVGSLQSVVELVTGRDYITGQSANRWVAAGGLVAGLVPGGKVVFKGGVKAVAKIAPKATVRTATRNVGYHATHPSVVPLIRQNGFRSGTASGRLGSGGTYVNNTPEGAIAEFLHHNPGVKPSVLKVDYRPGINASTNVTPRNYVENLPFHNVDSISAPSVRLPGTTNTNVLNGSLRIIE